MQNLDTLIELGFQRNFHGELFWRGTQKVFVAKIVDYNGPYPASEGSVARALIKYDLPSDKKENQLI